MYDGASALGEAVRMAARVTGHDVVCLPEAIAPWKRAVLRNYAEPAGIEIVEAPYDRETGVLDLDRLPDAASDVLYVESPNYFGVVEDRVEDLRERTGFLIMGMNPIALGVLRPPGAYGADVAVAEGQPLGLPPAFGGPLLGVLAARREYVRQMPGRLIAMTENANGDRAFTMTLQTREQHIRRHRATSNICTNHGLCAVVGAAYLSIVGPRLVTVAERCMENMVRLRRDLEDVGLAPRFTGHHFTEFVVRLPVPFDRFREEMLVRGILPGIHMDRMGMRDHMLVTTTEVHSDDDLKRYVDAVSEVIG